jgi:tetratricopeptide (TPR) repeat protein
MKTKLLFFLLLALCAVMLCGRFAQSTTAVSASVTAKEQPVQSVDKTLDEGLAALKSEHFDQAIKAAKQVLPTSSDSNTRIKAYRLLITAVRASDGYDAAIKRCGNAYAYAMKTRAAGQELVCVRAILTDLKQRRSQYLRTIAEQQRIMRLDKDRAAAASLKLASCKQALGPREEAIKAYEAVVKNYPLTRPGWKALEELAWMRQPKDVASATEPFEPVSTSLSDGLQALKEGRLSEAEKTARTLLVSSDAATHSSALDLLIESMAKSSGAKVAAKQAWQMACGTKEFNPTYSDVLRLEATVADLIDEPVKINETVAKADEPAKSSN